MTMDLVAPPGGEHEQVTQQSRDQGKLLLEILTLLFCRGIQRL